MPRMRQEKERDLGMKNYERSPASDAGLFIRTQKRIMSFREGHAFYRNVQRLDDCIHRVRP